MGMYEDYHEPGEKRLPDGTIIPAGHPAIRDILIAIL